MRLVAVMAETETAALGICADEKLLYQHGNIIVIIIITGGKGERGECREEGRISTRR